MRINPSRKNIVLQTGVTLIELIVFIVVVSIALLALTNVFNQAAMSNVDPLIRTRALEAAQSQLDEILALKYDANTPTGGIPACGSTTGAVCNNTTDGDFNDVDDYHGWSDTPYTGYSRSVSVTTNNNIKTISVTVNAPSGVSLTIAAERANF
jgi:MSHA pilin protein MshD